jgi:hypothetical protein
MLRAVFDTNVYISALITRGGRAEDAFLRVLENKAACYTSLAILTETAKKLREKFHWADAEIIDALKLISALAAVVKPSAKLSLLNDDPDNRILECAHKADADVIVTGDRHLLRLKKFAGIRILTIAEFLNETA